MQASVTTPVLNIRSKPNISSQILGVLQKDAVVDVVGESDNWLEIRHGTSVGFVSSHYTHLFERSENLRGVVTASLLNVRAYESGRAPVLGTLVAGSPVNIISQSEEWIEIEFNQEAGFVFKTYVELYTTPSAFRATVNTGVLNVRALPNANSAILGKLHRNNVLEVFSLHQDWAEIRFSGQPAYASNSYLDRAGEQDENSIPVADDRHDEELIPNVANILSQTSSIEPIKKLPVLGNNYQQKVARAWNQFGGLLGDLSENKAVDVACAVAVLCVESSGKGFEQNNKKRMIIRFENHKFWKYWGKNNTGTFHEHFSYSSSKVWRGHKWRLSGADDWQTFHGRQANEWKVFEFAKALDADAAMLSISMGAPQIMGFHYERIGYASVAEMYDRFSTDIAAHIEGLFGFFSSRMIKQLQTLDFEGFAGGYNGSGQKKKYGEWIEKHYDAFKQINH